MMYLPFLLMEGGFLAEDLFENPVWEKMPLFL